MITTVDQFLDRCAEIIEKGGFKKGDYGPPYDPAQPHCSIGAMRCANVEVGTLYTYGLYPMAAETFEKLLPQDGRVPYKSITLWNDDPKRRKCDVVRKFRQAANVWRKQHPTTV